MTTWPLTLEQVQEIVEYLLMTDTREGIILADKLNSAMGASARRRNAIADAPPYKPTPLTGPCLGLVR